MLFAVDWLCLGVLFLAASVFAVHLSRNYHQADKWPRSERTLGLMFFIIYFICVLLWLSFIVATTLVY